MFKIIADKEDADVAVVSLASRVVELEKKLSKISMDEEDAYDPLVSRNYIQILKAREIY